MSHAGNEGQLTADRREGSALSLETALVAHASVTFPAKAGGVGGGWGPSLAATAARLGRWSIPQGRAFSIAAWAGARFQGFIHLLTDDVHQALEDLLHVDILLGTGLKELETWMDIRGDTSETLGLWHHPNLGSKPTSACYAAVGPWLSACLSEPVCLSIKGNHADKNL